MSNISIHQRHPLQREGTSRISILIQALTPSYFQLDDRSMQDIIVAAHHYAQNLSFFGENNKPDGDWAAFWEVEALTYLAVLASLDTAELRKKYEDIDCDLAEALVSYNPAKGKPNPIPDLYRGLMNTLFDMAKGLEVMYGKLVHIKHPMQNLLLNVIKRDNQCDFEELEGALQRLVSLHKGADDKLQHDRYNIFYTTDDRWGIPDRKHYDLIKPDAKVTREKLRALFITFFNAYLMIVFRGQQAFDEELALMNKPDHEAYRIVEPHISLFLAFLRLFRHAQDSLNELTEAQLNYYYENVLCLHRRPAEPDHVHLIFTLAKNFDKELIEKGTLLIGGKDKNGVPMYYETLKDWVVTQAQVAEVKTVFVPKRFSFNSEDLDDADKFKSVVGSDFLPDGSIGHRTFGDDPLTAEAEIGFAINSPQLWLAEGNRWIEVKIDNVASPLFNTATEGFPADNLAIAVSTKKGWQYLDLPRKIDGTVDTSLRDNLFGYSSVADLGGALPLLASNTVNACYGIFQNGPQLYLQAFLPADFDALEPVEGDKMTQLPGIKLVLKKKRFVPLSNPYYKFLTSKDYPIQISVRAEGVSKSLIVQPDSGVLDGTQQVLPFGATAPKGAKMYLGNGEAFLKKLDKIKLNIDWVGDNDINYANYPSAPSGVYRVEFLHENIFKNPIDLKVSTQYLGNLFNPGTTTLDSTAEFAFSSDLKRNREYFRFEKFNTAIRRGFMRFTFEGELYHNEFSQILAKAAIDYGKTTNTADAKKLSLIQAALNSNTNPTINENNIQSILNASLTPEIPLPPYTPTFNSIKMDYISIGQEMEHDIDEFFHLHPFEGYEQRNAFKKPVQPFSLFADYTQFNNHSVKEIDGHLLIGLSGLIPGSNISLLIHTSEGTERDADRDIPKLHWSYLKKNNEWAPISPLKILLDTSFSFTKSGVIQIAVEEDISSEGNTMLNPELLWLRVLAEEGANRNAAALPDLLNLRTQVIEASLRMDAGLEPIHLTEGQKHSTISKLSISRSAVKTIEQLATTFGGRMAEASGLYFYQRISQRLRHRNRAILAWDYEHLLLAKFADVATAKCINHTQYKITQATELAPGFVTVAVIPDLRKRAGTSLENPRFPKGYLDEIRDYLNAHTNLFLNQIIGDHKYLQVINPQYEHLDVTIKVKFRPGVDEAYHKQRLSEDLKNYIAPWLLNSDAAPVFGRSLRKSGIVRFVEELPYIDYILELAIDKVGQSDTLGENIRPDAAHGILTTVPNHTVNS